MVKKINDNGKAVRGSGLKLRKQFKQFRIRKDLGEKAQWIAEQLGISEVKLFEDYVSNLFPIAGQYQGSDFMVIHYLPSLTGSTLTVQVLAQRSVLVSGRLKVPTNSEMQMNHFNIEGDFDHIAKTLSSKNFKPKIVSEVKN